jgi:O-antigen ligase
MKKIIALLPFLFYYGNVWNAPFLPNYDLHWYEIFFVGLFAAIMVKEKVSTTEVKLFFWVASIKIVAGFLSLFRTEHDDVAINGLLGMVVNFISFYLLIPLFLDKEVRLWVLVFHLLIMLSWSFEIQGLTNTQTELTYGSFGETQSNKNHIGIGLALAAIVAFYLILDFKYFKSNLINNFAKLGFSAYLIFILFNLSMIYARSSILAVVFGILIILFLKFLNTKGRVKLVFQGLGLVFGIFLLLQIFLPKIMSTATQWESILEKMEEDGTEGGTVGDRIELLNKGWYLVSQNPIIGVGIGGGRFPVANFKVGLMHNSYMAELVDLGLIGLMGTIIWVFYLRKFIAKKFNKVDIVDKSWLLMNTVLFFSMIFKDFSPLYLFSIFVAIIIYYSRIDLLNRKKIKINESRISLPYTRY